MINARFIKAEPTKDGITFILKAQKTKANMRLAVDLMDEECEISIATKVSLSFRGPIADVMDKIHDVISDFYEQLNIAEPDRCAGMMLPTLDLCDCGHDLEQHEDPDHTGMLFCREQGCKCANFIRPTLPVEPEQKKEE